MFFTHNQQISWKDCLVKSSLVFPSSSSANSAFGALTSLWSRVTCGRRCIDRRKKMHKLNLLTVGTFGYCAPWCSSTTVSFMHVEPDKIQVSQAFIWYLGKLKNPPQRRPKHIFNSSCTALKWRLMGSKSSNVPLFLPVIGKICNTSFISEVLSFKTGTCELKWKHYFYSSTVYICYCFK